MESEKDLRLKSRKRLGELFSKGNRLKSFPVHLIHHVRSESLESKSTWLQFAVSAPKRIHRSAVQRNRLKRLMREAFRPFITELESFMENEQTGLDIMLIYVGPEELALVDIRAKIKVLLNRLEEHYKSSGSDE